jgi:hypothetical protein
MDTNKFYYNLTTQVIDARVSTGAYKRPKDFLHDIRSLMKDAKTLGIPENILKANNMHGYAMAEMNAFEILNPQLVAECEAVYARDLERARLAAETTANKEKAQNIITSVTETTQSGPIQLGESVLIQPDLPPPTTPQRPIASNGEEQSNGTTIPSNAAEFTPMDIQDDSSSGARPQFPVGSVVTPSGPTTQPLSQRSAVEKMAPGTQATDYHNSASTTTSGQKTSDGSNRSSDRNRPGPHTQSTNGATQPESQPVWPDFDSLLPPFEGGSQIPDTQSTSSIPLAGRLARPIHGKMTRAFTVIVSAFMPLTIISEHAASNVQHDNSQSSGSQAHAFPKPALPAHIIAAQQSQNQHSGLATAPPSSFVDPAGIHQAASNAAVSNGTHSPHTSNIADVLNPPQPPPEFVLDEVSLQAMHNDLAERTNGLTVEQIEMVMARCMDVVLRMRHLWDRSDVIDKLGEAFAEVLADVMWQNGLGMEGVEWTGGDSLMT